MIKQVLHKVVSILMAFLVVFSTVSFTIEKHFCGDTLIDVSVFSSAKTCSSSGNLDVTMPSFQDNSCCKDTVHFVAGIDEITVTPFDNLEHVQQVFLVSYAYAFLGLYQSLPKPIIPHKNYSPPNLVADIQLCNQVFII